MADSPTIININGTDYYCPSDRLDDLFVIDGALINTSSSTVTLYGSFRETGVNNSGYPRINCSSFQKATYQSSYNASVSTLTVSSYEVNNRSFDDVFLIGVVIVGLLAMLLFKKR